MSYALRQFRSFVADFQIQSDLFSPDFSSMTPENTGRVRACETIYETYGKRYEVFLSVVIMYRVYQTKLNSRAFSIINNIIINVEPV